MKATGIVRRIDDLGRVVIPKEIRRTMRLREGEPLQTTLTPEEKNTIAVHVILKRYKEQAENIGVKITPIFCLMFQSASNLKGIPYICIIAHAVPGMLQ